MPPSPLHTLRLSSLAAALLCAGCQSFDGVAQAPYDRTPRLVAGLRPVHEPVPRRLPVAYDGSDIWGRLGQGFSLVDDNGLR